MTTFCQDCDFVHPETRKDAPWRWRCMEAPVEERGFGFVSQDYAPNPPYQLCSRLNTTGDCPMFTPRREAPAKSTKGEV